jgi:DNA-binding CsgD family transcriptional regulator
MRNMEKEDSCKLTSREIQVLCLIASGKSIREIVTQLKVSPHTVGAQRAPCGLLRRG